MRLVCVRGRADAKEVKENSGESRSARAVLARCRPPVPRPTVRALKGDLDGPGWVRKVDRNVDERPFGVRTVDDARGATALAGALWYPNPS